jgi:hypothetical protein
MLRLITAVSILAIAAPAMAQDAAPGPSEQPSAESQPEAPAPAPAAEPAASAVPAALSKEDTVKQVVETEFPTYDADSSGDLNTAEFNLWLTALKGKSDEAKGATQPKPAAEMNTWLKGAFAKADTDKSKNVSKAELQSFLLG